MDSREQRSEGRSKRVDPLTCWISFRPAIALRGINAVGVVVDQLQQCESAVLSGSDKPIPQSFRIVRMPADT